MPPYVDAIVDGGEKMANYVHVDDSKERDQQKNTFLGLQFSQPVKYQNIITIGLLHLLAVYFIIVFPYIQKWRLFIYGIIMAQFAGFGITGAAHRYFTHRTFKATLPLKIFLLVAYATAGENSLYEWVRDHRVHHKYCETDADPHNARNGFFFAHCGWLMMKKHPDVIRKGKLLDMTDMSEDKLLAWYNGHFLILKIMFCFIIPTIVPPLLWNESIYWTFVSQCIVRYTAVLNSSWLVNSAAHLYGTKPYDKSIYPSENLLVSIFAMGEGWHNYHHTFPWDYKASEYGKLNFTTVLLDLFGRLGLAYDFKSPNKELVDRISLKNGDGTRQIAVQENGRIEYTTN